MTVIGAYPAGVMKNQAGARAMSEQAPLAIREAAFGSAKTAAAIQHNALRPDPSCFWRNRPDK
jgi:hypothetical protein